MSLFQEFSPIFRLVNDYERAARCAPRQHVPTFKPRFDVRELENSYELLGELPGISQEDVSIEWKDATTLAISGRTQYRAHKAVPAPKEAQQTTETSEPESAAAAKENEYQQPSVSDEEGETSDDFVDVPSQSEKAAGKKPQQEEAAQASTPAEKAKYWVSERSVGTFQRAFTFPVRIDQDAVTASLKNGVLSIVIPKKITEPRKINIE